ncbi:MAG TPA: recombinase family protein [Rhizomicrobium sp.]|jgi:DNA invertase Pin-like site-specific DNA recombinase|nr:recombinase family protein [Rhizomicrobium sp.]
MTKGNFVAYFRVSTQRQGQSGLGLADQRKQVTDHLNGGDWKLVDEFTEVESGRKKARPELKAALAACRKHKATLIIANISRLARNVAFISALLESKVRFVCCDMPSADTAFLQMAAVFAEWEAKKISERTTAALQQAKKNGKKLGWRIPGREKQQAKASRKGAAVNHQQAAKFAANVLPIINDIRKAGVTTLEGIAAALNARGVATARDGQWYPTTVRNVLAYA